MRLGLTGMRSASASISHVPSGSYQPPTDDETEYASRDDLRPGGAPEAVQKVLNGLKTFGIKGQFLFFKSISQNVSVFNVLSVNNLAGQLYLIIMMHRELVTITIDVGKHFQSNSGLPCNSYVRVSIPHISY